MNDVIIISGCQGSGKTTMMKKLKDNLSTVGVRTEDLIFADTIYQIHNFAIDLLKKRGIERDLVKDGKLLQMLGTEWGRNTIDDNIWVKCVQGEMANLSKDATGPITFLISDCRFKNEFDSFPNAFTVRLEASKEARKERCSQWRDNDTHPSEIDLNDYAEQRKFTCYIDTEQPQEDCFMNLSAALLLWKIDKSIKGLGYGEVASKYYGGAK